MSTDARTGMRTDAGANETSAIARTSEALQPARSSTLDVSEEQSELGATEQESTGIAQQLSTEVKAALEQLPLTKEIFEEAITANELNAHEKI